MSRATEALEVLRKAGMKLSTSRGQSSTISHEASEKVGFEFAPEVPVCSIEVEKTNYDTVRMKLTDINRDEAHLKATIDMLIEAICMLREEMQEVRRKESGLPW